MTASFYLDRDRWTTLDDPGLREELSRRTGSDSHVESILRSLARFGTDPSIRDFCVSPRATRTASRVAKTVVWTVGANRS